MKSEVSQAESLPCTVSIDRSVLVVGVGGSGPLDPPFGRGRVIAANGEEDKIEGQTTKAQLDNTICPSAEECERTSRRGALTRCNENL